MSVIDEYLQDVSEPERAELQRIRSLIQEMVPDAVEAFSYGIPCFKYKNHYFIGFAAYKDHLSLFPSSQPIAELGSKLSAFKTSPGTIQFRLDKPLPEDLLREIIDVRLVAAQAGK